MLTQEKLCKYVKLQARKGVLPCLRTEVKTRLPDPQEAKSHEVLWMLVGNEILQMLDESVEQGTQSGFYAFTKAVNLMEKTGFISPEKLAATLELTSA